MTDRCPVTDTPPLIWWEAYSTDETNEKVRQHAAQKFGVPPGDIELERNGGCVLTRVKKEKIWTPTKSLPTAQMTLNF